MIGERAMLRRLTKHLAPPVFDDPDKTRVARLLNVMLLAVAAMFVGLALFDPIIQTEPAPVILFSIVSAALVLFVRQQMAGGAPPLCFARIGTTFRST